MLLLPLNSLRKDKMTSYQEIKVSCNSFISSGFSCDSHAPLFILNLTLVPDAFRFHNSACEFFHVADLTATAHMWHASFRKNININDIEFAFPELL